MGAKQVYAAASHGLFVGNDSQASAHPALEKVVITNMIPPFRLASEMSNARLVVLDAVALFPDAIKRIHSGGSIVDLLET